MELLKTNKDKEDKEMKRTAFDMDGVICSFDIKELRKTKNIFEEARYYDRQIPVMKEEDFPEGKVIVISARDKHFYNLTMRWLKKHYPNIQFDLNLVGYDSKSAERKLQVMHQKGVSTFYDDSPHWCEYFRQCGIKTVEVKGD